MVGVFSGVWSWGCSLVSILVDGTEEAFDDSKGCTFELYDNDSDGGLG